MRKILILILTILLCNLVSASITVDLTNISTEYHPDETISGYLKVYSSQNELFDNTENVEVRIIDVSGDEIKVTNLAKIDIGTYMFSYETNELDFGTFYVTGIAQVVGSTITKVQTIQIKKPSITSDKSWFTETFSKPVVYISMICLSVIVLLLFIFLILTRKKRR